MREQTNMQRLSKTNLNTHRPPGEAKLYVKLNSERNHSIATIHAWRAGYNDSARIQHLRHQKSDNKCTECNVEEDVEHIIKHCPKHYIERHVLQETLAKHNFNRNADLYEIVLCSNNYENHIRHNRTDARTVDNAIKNFADWVHKRRHASKKRKPEDPFPLVPRGPRAR